MRKKKEQANTTPGTATRKEHVAVRLDTEALARVDAERDRIAAAMPGFDVTRSDALRSLVLRGLDAPVLGAGGPVVVKGEC